MKNKTMLFLMSAILVMCLTACSQPNIENTSDTTASASDQSNIEDTSGAIDSASDTVGQINDAADVSQSAAAVSSTDTGNITEEEAKEAALSHAGLSEVDVTFISVHLDRDNGRQVYEVEFHSGNTEYDYDVDAETGEIVSYDYDVENYIISSGASTVQSTGEYIGEDAAKAIALAEVSGATESNIRLYLDHDDGMALYEGSIVYNELKYEFEINATDGTIMDWDVESVYDD